MKPCSKPTTNNLEEANMDTWRAMGIITGWSTAIMMTIAVLVMVNRGGNVELSTLLLCGLVIICGITCARNAHEMPRNGYDD